MSQERDFRARGVFRPESRVVEGFKRPHQPAIWGISGRFRLLFDTAALSHGTGCRAGWMPSGPSEDGPRLVILIGYPHIILISRQNQVPMTERRCCAPASKRETAMSAVIYPLHFERRFARKWARSARDASPAPMRRSRPESTDTCACGQVLVAPYNSTYSAKAVINKWHCMNCNAKWSTIADIWRA